MSGLRKRSLVIAGHSTSVALEAEFWHVLEEMARARGHGLGAMIAAIDAVRGPDTALASALRVAALLRTVPPAEPDLGLDA